MLLKSVDIIGKIMYTGSKPNLSQFDLRMAIFENVENYLKKAEMKDIDTFTLLKDELIITESINDPYGVVSNISAYKNVAIEQGRAIIDSTFEKYLSNGKRAILESIQGNGHRYISEKIKGLLIIYFEKI